METARYQTIEDLLAWPDGESVELIDGEILRRSMSRFEYGQVQTERNRGAGGSCLRSASAITRTIVPVTI